MSDNFIGILYHLNANVQLEFVYREFDEIAIGIFY